MCDQWKPYLPHLLHRCHWRKLREEVQAGDRLRQPTQTAETGNICARVSNTNVEGIPASDLVAEAVRTTRLPLRHFGMHNPIYINGSQQFSRASLQRVVAGMDTILSGKAQEDYRTLPRSKWTHRTLQAYANLDDQQLSGTRQQSAAYARPGGLLLPDCCHRGC